jgi:dihydrofolate synthase / folylpolyglutamate synthase
MAGYVSPIGTVEALLAPRLEQRILPGLERMERALARLGHPEQGLRTVLIVGTNGKGSTAALLADILAAHGLRVGLYTSPHLLRVEERIVVDGTSIAQERMLELLRELARWPELSFFETLTLAAVLEFVERKVDLAVLEAGLGGRWDASNAVPPAVSLLTNVGTDHQAWLGDTRPAIAAEKAAALRGREAIVGSWDAEVEGAIRAGADPATPLTLASDWARVTGRLAPGAGLPALEGGQSVRFAVGDAEGSARLPLSGKFQLDNLRLALAGAAALARHSLTPPLRGAALARGMAAVSWPGRLQPCRVRGRRLVLDGAHNREAVAALADALDRLGLSGEVQLLFSCLADKPLAAMAGMLRPRVRQVVVAPIASPRATPLSELAAAFPGCRTAATVDDAVDRLDAGLPALVTGSLRLVGEVTALMERGSDG